MPIVADIEDLDPAELLLVLSLSSKTGRLTATRGGQKIMLALRDGSIVYAASPAVRERLGSILVNRGVISEDDLRRALERQSQQLEPKVLGTVLVEMGLVSPSAVQEAVLRQFEAVIRQLLAWDRGEMSFQPSEVADLGAVSIDPAELLVVIGYESGSPLVKGLVRLALKRAARTIKPRAGGRPAPPTPEPAAQPGPRANDPVRAMLRDMDRLAVSLTAEMTMAILRAAAEVAPRALLMVAHSDHLGGIGGFGKLANGRPVTGQQLRVPLREGSRFSQVAAAGRPWRGRPDHDDAEVLAGTLGHPTAGDAILVPLVVDGVTVAMLYADGGPKGEPLAAVDTLLATVAKVAQALALEGEPRREAPAVT